MNSQMTEKSLFKTFLSYAVPCIIGMFLTSFITVVDGMFIGWKMGERGLAAVNLTLPVLYLLLGLTIMVGVGGSTLAMQSLGEKDLVKAQGRFNFSLVINNIVNLFVILVLILFMENIIEMLNPKGDLITELRDYLGTMCYFYLFMMMNLTFGMFIRGEGKPQLSVFLSIIGNLVNIALDYLFIMRLDMGLKGAALASGIAVIVTFLLSLRYFMSKKSIFKYRRPSFIKSDLKNIIFNGSSEFISQIACAITIYLINSIIMKRIGIHGVAAFTIMGYISFIEYMVITGIAQGIHPLISYNYGAKDYKIISRLLSIGMRSVMLVGFLATAVSILASEGIMKVFVGNNQQVLGLGTSGFRLFALSFLINGVNVIASTYFTSLGNAKASAVISVLRGLVLISFFILVLPPVIGDTGIWLTAPLTEAFTLLVAFLLLKRSTPKTADAAQEINVLCE